MLFLTKLANFPYRLTAQCLLYVVACKTQHFRPQLIANNKMQAIPMKAANGNHQILRLPIVSQRPITVVRTKDVKIK
jgi:hypothetical protein